MNVSNLRKTRLSGWFEYYRETCPVCHKRGGCMINEKGDTVVCIRTESNILFSKDFQSWIHRLKDQQVVNIKDAKGSVKTHTKIAASILDVVYNTLLDSIKLENSHLKHLTDPTRGMSRKEVEVRGYRSFPEKPWETVKMITSKTGYTKFPGVPGFYSNKFGWTISGMGGIMIPYRNQYNQVVGFQIRVDKPKNDVEINVGDIPDLMARVKTQPNLVQVLNNGEIILEKEFDIGQREEVIVKDNYADSVNRKGSVKLVSGQRYFWLSSANKNDGCGAGGPLPIHVAVPTTELENWGNGTLHKSKAVWLTEGALKADIAADHIVKVYDAEQLKELGTTILAIPGVNTWRSIFPMLKEMGVETVTIALDMDAMTNDKVEKQLKALIQELKNEGYHANIAMWNKNDGNGIDDVLINKRFPQIKKIF